MHPSDGSAAQNSELDYELDEISIASDRESIIAKSETEGEQETDSDYDNDNDDERNSFIRKSSSCKTNTVHTVQNTCKPKSTQISDNRAEVLHNRTIAEELYETNIKHTRRKSTY